MRIAALLLAAGRSQRFGAADKLSVPLHDRPLGLHAATTLVSLPIAARIVVTGPVTFDWPDFQVIANDRPAMGMGHSIALGMAAVRRSGADAVVIALADMPFVSATHLRRLLDRYRGAASLIASGDGKHRLPPALFGADWFDALERITGDEGARHLLASAEIVVASPAELADIDRPGICLPIINAAHGPSWCAKRWTIFAGGPMRFVINDQSFERDIDLRTSLLDLLRDHARLSGTKKGCNQGACGACTVLVDGERILSCLSLAVQYENRCITTVEGLADGSRLHALQAAFVEHDGLQCGYCTPGQLCSAIGMAAELKRGLPSYVTGDLTASRIASSREELAERMSGNLCRCGAYNGIIDAIDATFGDSGSSNEYVPDMPEKVA